MTKQTLILLHGWGFDASIWDAVRTNLDGWPMVLWDRGYFGTASAPQVDGPSIAIGHSLGALLLANALPQRIPLIAINGFDSFTGEGAVERHTVQVMRKRFETAPLAVLNGFRTRCGAPPAPGPINHAALASDFDLLTDGHAAAGRRRILLLQGGADPILPAPLRAGTFPGADRLDRQGGGHLLPITEADWCAAQIREFACA